MLHTFMKKMTTPPEKYEPTSADITVRRLPPNKLDTCKSVSRTNIPETPSSNSAGKIIHGYTVGTEKRYIFMLMMMMMMAMAMAMAMAMTMTMTMMIHIVMS